MNISEILERNYREAVYLEQQRESLKRSSSFLAPGFFLIITSLAIFMTYLAALLVAEEYPAEVYSFSIVAFQNFRDIHACPHIANKNLVGF